MDPRLAEMVLGPILRNRFAIVLFLSSAIVSSLALTYVASEKFETGVAIYYRPVATTLLRQRSTAVMGGPVPFTLYKTVGQTLRDLVKSDTILKPIVAELKLHEKQPPAEGSGLKAVLRRAKDGAMETLSDAWSILRHGRVIEGNAFDDALSRLRSNVDISVAQRESYLFVLTARDRSPERVRRIVDLAAANLVAFLAEQDDKANRERHRSLRKLLARKEAAIQSLRRERARILKRSQVASIPDETTRGVENLYSMELEETKLGSLVDEKTRKIEEYENVLQGKIQKFGQPEDLKKVRSSLLFETIERKGLLRRKEALRASIEELKGKLGRMPDLKRRAEEIDARIEKETSERNQLNDLYIEVSQELVSSETEVRVLHSAAVPARPVQPIKIYHVGLTAMLGIFLAVGSAYFADYLARPGEPGDSSDA